MPQLAASADRRGSPRRPTAFVFRLITEDADTAAWMVNQSEGGAAFLCPAERVPRISSVVDLRLMQCDDGGSDIRARTDERLELPQVARVLRVSTAGATREVAVRFLSPNDAGLRHVAGSGAVCRKSAPAARVSHPIAPATVPQISAPGAVRA